MFWLWLWRKLTIIYEDHIVPIIPPLRSLYKLWVGLSFIFVFIDVFFFNPNGDYATTSRLLHDTIAPLSYWTALIPFFFYQVWRFTDWLRAQRTDYDYFKESGGKLKNEEKAKNDQYEDDNDIGFYKLHQQPPYPVSSGERAYHEGYKRGIQNAVERVYVPNPAATPLELQSDDIYSKEIIREGSIRASGYSSLLLDYGASSTDAFYCNCMILIVSGNGVGQIRFIVAYNGKTREGYIDEPWEIIPEDNSGYTIINEPTHYNKKEILDSIFKEKVSQVDDAVWDEEKSDTDIYIDISPDFGEEITPTNILTSEDGEIIDTDLDDSPMTLEDLLNNQKKDQNI